MSYEPNNELGRIFKDLWAGVGHPDYEEQAISAINSLTLKQVIEMIGPDVPEFNDLVKGSNATKAELRQSAERIWS